MMLPTHIMVGALLGLGLASIAPEFAGVILVGAILGSVIPDLDMYLEHRKTLHYPVYYSLFSVPAIGIAILVPTVPTVGVAVTLGAAGIHSLLDIYGGSLELRPWERTDNRAVYDHWHGRWIPPRRVVQYDGSPRDLVLALGLGLPVVVVSAEPLTSFLLVTLTIAAIYTLVRRRLPDIANRLLDLVFDDFLPPRLVARLPARYQKERLKPE